MAKKRIAVVGAGASGCSIAWSLTQAGIDGLSEVTVFHDDDEVGGHSRTIPIWFDAAGKGHVATTASPAPAGQQVFPVDIGVQFVCPTLYPNLYQQLKRPELATVKLTNHPQLKISGSFSPTLNWGNFPAYQSGPRFDGCYDPATVELAKNMQRDLRWGPFTPLDGITFSTSVERYLQVANVPWTSNFFRYLLIPYLCIINGYGTSDLLETTFEDLFPIFVKIPGLQHLGPYGSFTSPGTGWDRFTDGATAWCASMAAYATLKGATFRTGTKITAVWPRTDGKVGIRHVPTATPGAPPTEEVFDDVVLTTDMTMNRQILDNPQNALYATQKDYLSASRFALIPGECFIHQDDECLSPHLRDKLEDGQFVGSYAWSPTTSNVYGLPYDLSRAFQTYLMKNILGTPVDCHVSMYEAGVAAKKPDPQKVLYYKDWRHGRWVTSFFDKAKKELHRIQGLGRIWFAGNNTTVDSEEGALISGMVIANKLQPEFTYPFDLASEAFFFFEYFQNTMFPKRSLPWVLGQAVADADEHLQAFFAGTGP